MVREDDVFRTINIIGVTIGIRLSFFANSDAVDEILSDCIVSGIICEII